MKINKLNKIFKNILILFSLISLLAAFFIEEYKTFSLTDILFMTILIILLALYYVGKGKLQIHLFSFMILYLFHQFLFMT